MSLRLLLSSVACPILLAGVANAQVTVPLPRPTTPVNTPQSTSPRPGQPIVATPARRQDQAANPSGASGPQVPLGPHGRPDINPYNRDIDMTVPLTFQSRTLGDIPLRLTADDRYFLEVATFLRLMRPILNEEAHTALAARLQSLTTFDSETLAQTGVQLIYDPTSLAVVVVQVSPEQRAINNLFAPPRDDLNDESAQPAGFSAYLNLNVVQTYIWEADDTDPPAVNLDGAVRVGPIVFEGEGQFSQQFDVAGSAYKFDRSYARFVYDQPAQFRRWYLGDLDPEVRGQQSFVQIGGIGVARQQRRFNSFRSAVLQGNRQLVLQRESTVRFLRNGTLYRELRLDPGRYDFSSLPLLSGSNDIQVEVRDNSGSVQNLSFQQYLDPIDLDPGDYEYGAYLGLMSRDFGRAPDYRGEAAFTGFYRKAFFNAPAIGVGLQLSEQVQNVTGQTQFVLPNGSRLLLDGGASNSKVVGAGFAAGLGFDQFVDRAGLSDNFSIRADFLSKRYATLGNEAAFNPTSWSINANYSRQFSQNLTASLNAAYLAGRRDIGNSYRIGLSTFYRISNRWTLRSGVDYARLPSQFASGNGFSVNVGIVWQPNFRQRAEARYETRENLAELSYTQSGLNRLDSVGFGGIVTRQDGSAQVQGFAGYVGNRFDASLSHASLGADLDAIGDINATSVRVGTSIAFADGVFGVGRRINDSFALVYPHENLRGRSVVAGQSIAQNNYIGRSGTFGAAVNNFLASYVTQSVQYDVDNAPTGYDIGSGVVRVRPLYRSGYKIRVGTDAFVSAMGTLTGAQGPVALIGGRVTLLDVREGENPQPTPFFTNSVGRFAISSLLPGRRYKVETYGPNGSTDASFEFDIPVDTDGLVDLGIVRSADGVPRPTN